MAEKSKEKQLPPGRKQYLEFKKLYKDALLLFQIGDFYETFGEDAKLMSKVLGIALTSRDVGHNAKTSLAGIPVHSLHTRLKRLVDFGLKVVVVDQVVDQQNPRKLFERKVTRIVTAGTLIEPQILDAKHRNHLVALFLGKEKFGVAWADLSSSVFMATEVARSAVLDELERLEPVELITTALGSKFLESTKTNYVVRQIEDTKLDDKENFLRNHIGDKAIKAFLSFDMPNATAAAAMVVEYISKTQPSLLVHLAELSYSKQVEFLDISLSAMRDLEVVKPKSSSGVTLYSCLNFTKTAMGARLLREWLVRPLSTKSAIERRQRGVQELFLSDNLLDELRQALAGIDDLERVAGRLLTSTITKRELLQIKSSLSGLKTLSNLTKNLTKTPAIKYTKWANECYLKIEEAISENDDQVKGYETILKSKWNKDLDELRSLASGAGEKLTKLEETQRKKLGIKNLKISYNRVFGYYIEVSKSNIKNVPSDYLRKQTLVNAERFTTPLLSEIEAEVLRAREQLASLEKSLYLEFVGAVSIYAKDLLVLARQIAVLDVLVSLSYVARKEGWVKPKIEQSLDLVIKDGAHPQMQKALGVKGFVANDVSICQKSNQILVITGPNMSGKSTYIRMVGVLTILAHIGSYLPASEAKVGIVDQIFTRTGASDDITAGNSTFMNEMLEVSTILNKATPRSLAIMDEVGRGTSTYDGIAISQAVLEEIHNGDKRGLRTLFATHYHELTELEKSLKRLKNLKVEVKEEGEKVYFMHRIVEGVSNRSYGIFVADIAGVPKKVIQRARDILSKMELRGAFLGTDTGKDSLQVPLISLNPLVDKEKTTKTNPHMKDNKGEIKERLEDIKKSLLDVDIENTTPLEALKTLSSIKAKLEKW